MWGGGAGVMGEGLEEGGGVGGMGEGLREEWGGERWRMNIYHASNLPSRVCMEHYLSGSTSSGRSLEERCLASFPTL